MTARPITVALFVFVSALSTLSAAEGKLEIQPDDTIQSVIARYQGQTVELRLKSGEKIGGKVEKVTGALVQLSQLAGAEFFDAAVAVGDISAVVVRAKK